MPLPDGGNTTHWPPRQLDPVFARIDSWDAWYTGEPDHLAEVYGSQYASSFDATSRARLINHPSQYRGGIVGKLARWFWGSPVPLGEMRTKLHVPLAADIAAKSSKLLFSEPPTFTTENTGTQARLEELLDDGFRAMLLEAGETCAGLGGVYLRAVWDKDVADKPMLHASAADVAVPEWRWSTLQACTFWRILEDDGTRVVRHLERHERGAIFHGLYEGTPDMLGRKIPLNEHDGTTEYVDQVVDGDRIETGIQGMTAGYVPNMKPNRLWRKIPQACELGRADISGVEPLLDALDETWTSWMRDIRIGKGRIVVPDAYLQSNGPGRGAAFDAEREIYSGLSMLPQPGATVPITVAQFAIRVEEHERTTRELTAAILRDAGYSQQSFGMTGDVAITATEVSAKERESFLTRGHKTLYWTPELARFGEVLLELDREHFGGKAEVERPKLEWPDGVAEDPEKTARTIQLLDAAGAVSTRTKVEMLHPEWDKDKVDKEVGAIDGQAVENPDTFTGSPITINRPNQDSDQEQEVDDVDANA